VRQHERFDKKQESPPLPSDKPLTATGWQTNLAIDYLECKAVFAQNLP
jgi:hypothetical protein